MLVISHKLNYHFISNSCGNNIICVWLSVWCGKYIIISCSWVNYDIKIDELFSVDNYKLRGE